MDDPRLYVRAAETIATRIRAGEYESGRRLYLGPLADELGVGRRTMAHAMVMLESRGLVQFWEGLGWYVR